MPPVLLFVILYGSTNLALNSFVEMPKVKQRLVSGAVATAPVMLLLLASLGQLTSRDTLLSLLFVGGLAMYFSRVSVVHSP